MSLEGIEGMSRGLKDLVRLVRLFMRDHPELNRLTQGEESGDRTIAWAVLDAVSLYNDTPPFTRYDVDGLLARGRQYLLVRMTTVTLLESVAHLMVRNHINYSVGGMSVGMNDKAPLLMNFIQYYKATVDQMLLRVKVAENVNSILGAENYGNPSEYWITNSSYLTV